MNNQTVNNQTGVDFFDEKTAAAYDQRWTVFSAMQTSLYQAMRQILAELPDNARILTVGAGTGSELIALAEQFPKWQFTAVEPSSAMLAVCRQRIAERGFAARCTFHAGFLDALPAAEPFDAATCLFVSQFLMQPGERSRFFNQIAVRLRPAALLISGDLSADTSSAAYESLLKVWMRMVKSPHVTREEIEGMRQSHNSMVAVLPPAEVAAIIEAGGFELPVLFFQYLLMHAWFTKRAAF